MNTKWKLLIPLVFVSTCGWSARAIAHGARLNARETQAIELSAEYDTGEPMSAAPVTVYSPENPSQPWLQGTTDQKGNFVFTPDSSQPGNWTVQVRQAGHGDIINIPVGGDTAAAGGAETGDNGAVSRVRSTATSNPAFTPLQIVLISAAVIWGFIGTALFFARGNKSSDFHSSES
ncbi:MAG: carboxypeptidase-like regulatory domain-containing protein [Kastovskya adunca ATA6-11-RM4]|jgi:nickel transport protein|nr:carboxypeptidase-like regulatory domain-containing protein [Kastovskya adunca ATA6-11-RM4]